jgi:hypothetical protein
VTHHSLSRSAQRWGVRTVADLSAAIEEIATVAFKYLTNRSLTDPANSREADADSRIKSRREAWFDTPPECVRLPMPGGEPIVVKKHETRPALVVATVLG